MKQIVIAQDVGSVDECLYVNGIAWSARGESTVYACDVASVCDVGEPITYELRRVNNPDRDWPKSLDELERADAE